jgi:hypothetical protein
MVAPKNSVTRQSGPAIRRRIPYFSGVGRTARKSSRSLGSAAAARHQHLAIRQERGVVLLASISHRCDRSPRGRSRSQINAFRGFRGYHRGSRGGVEVTLCSPHDQHLAGVIHRRRAPVACPVDAVADDRPGTRSRRVQVAGGLARPRAEDLAVRCQEHIGVVGLQELRAGEISPGTACCLPHLRQDIRTGARIDHSGHDQHVPVRQHDGGRVPPTGVHVGQTDPGVGEGAVDRGVGQAHVVRDVPACEKQSAVRQEREARAENIEASLSRCANATCRWIPKLRMVGVRIRIPKHHLTGREHLCMYRPVRPRLHSRPLTDTRGLGIRRRANAYSTPHDHKKRGSRP